MTIPTEVIEFLATAAAGAATSDYEVNDAGQDGNDDGDSSDGWSTLLLPQHHDNDDDDGVEVVVDISLRQTTMSASPSASAATTVASEAPAAATDSSPRTLDTTQALTALPLHLAATSRSVTQLLCATEHWRRRKLFDSWCSPDSWFTKL